MKSLMTLLVVVLIVYGLSQWMIQAKPAAVESQRSSSGSTSDAVRDSLNQSTEDYQNKLDQAMENSGAGS